MIAKKWNILVVLGVVITFGSTVYGAEWTARQKLMAKRAAELDAYRNLAERVMGLKVTAESIVKDFMAESDKITLSMDHFIKGIRIGDAKTSWYDDGTCEVVAEVTLSKVIKELRTSCDKYYKGDKWTTEKFEQINTYTQERVLTEIGSAAIRPESIIAEPQSVPVVMPIVNPRDKHIDLPEIYKQQPAKNRLMAKRVATADAYRKLVERVYGLRITASTFVKDFVGDDRIRTKVEHYLRGQKIDEVRYQPDGIVEVQVSLTLKRVITTLKRVCDEYFTETGKRIKTETFEEIEKNTKRRTVTVIGMGAITTEHGEAPPATGWQRKTTIEIIEEGPEVIEPK